MKKPIDNVLQNLCYESITGALNKSIIELSGNYKIVVGARSTGYKLYLQDYTGYSFEIDKTKSFIPQLCKFLKNSPKVDKSKILYAGYSKGSQLCFHIPMYFDNDTDEYPTHAVIMKCLNKEYNVSDIENIYKESTTIDVVNLESTGLMNIITEMKSLDLQSPVKLYWSGDNKNHTLILNGLDYNSGSVTSKSINIIDYVLNNSSSKTDLDTLNSVVLDKFVENNMIYPSFINFEFEFESPKTSADVCDFQNFYTFFSKVSSTTPAELIKMSFADCKPIKTYSFSTNNIIFKDIDILKSETYKINSYDEPVTSILVKDINEQPYLYKVKPSNITQNDVIKISNKAGTIIEYQVKSTDMLDTLYQRMIRVGNKISYLSNNVVEVTSTTEYWYFRSSEQLIFEFLTGGKVSKNYVPADRTSGEDIYYKSMKISLNDVATDYEIETGITKLRIGSTIYNIERTFKYDGRVIIRLDVNPQLTLNVIGNLMKTYYEELSIFKPIPILNTYNELLSLPLYDFDAYYKELLTKKDDETQAEYQARYDAFKNYTRSNMVSDPVQYDGVTRIENESDIMFVNGSNSYFSSHSMNYDSRTGMNNGNLLEFGYFLIKGECPNYMKGDYREDRYFTDTPKHRSLLRRISTKTCECVFLGLKYSLDIRYEGYKLCTYLDPEKVLSTNSDYYVVINHIKKTIDIVINKRVALLYIDKIDLSLFYNTENYFELDDTDVDNFIQIGFKFGKQISDTDYAKNPTYYDPLTNKYIPITDFVVKKVDKYNNEYAAGFLVMRDENSEDDFISLYNNKTSIVVLRYASDYVRDMTSAHTPTYETFTLFRIEFTNITELHSDYFIAEDIVVRMLMGESDLDGKQIRLFGSIDGSGLLYDITGQSLVFNETAARELQQRYKHDYTDTTSTWVNVFLTRYFEATKTGTISDINQLTEDVSLRSQYFRLLYGARDAAGTNIPPSYDVPFELEFKNSYPNWGNQSTTADKLKWLENFANKYYIATSTGKTYTPEFLNTLDRAESRFNIDLFDSNKFWDIISVYAREMQTNKLSKKSLYRYMSRISLTTFKNYCKDNTIDVNDSDVSTKVNLVSIDVNKSKSGTMKRFSTHYIPYMVAYGGLLDAQIQNADYGNMSIIHTLFDENFGYYSEDTTVKALSDTIKINATSLWDEIHNIVSTMFIGNDLTISVTNPSSVIDLRSELREQLSLSLMTIVGNNEEYISKVSGDTEYYTRDMYSQYILKNFYDVEYVSFDDSKVDFEYDKTKMTITLKNELKVGTYLIKITRIE